MSFDDVSDSDNSASEYRTVASCSLWQTPAQETPLDEAASDTTDSSSDDGDIMIVSFAVGQQVASIDCGVDDAQKAHVLTTASDCAASNAESMEQLLVAIRVARVEHQSGDDCFKLSPESDVTRKMVSILCDWLLSVTKQFKMRVDTFIDAVYLLRRSLTRSGAFGDIRRDRLQLLGMACLDIASRCNEIHHPEVRDYYYICDKSYSPKEIVDTQRQVLWRLRFDVHPKTHLFFSDALAHLFLEPWSTEESYLRQYIGVCVCVCQQIEWHYEALHIALAVLQIARLTVSCGQEDLRHHPTLWQAVDVQLDDLEDVLQAVHQCRPSDDSRLRAAPRMFGMKKRHVSDIDWHLDRHNSAS